MNKQKITKKEWLKKFKEGVESITPQQKLKIDMRSTVISCLGYFSGIIITLIKLESIGLLTIALILIFLGALISTTLKYIGQKQQYKAFKEIDQDSINMNDIEDLKEYLNGDKLE